MPRSGVVNAGDDRPAPRSAALSDGPWTLSGHPRFYALEGLDGSGKSTQLTLLAEALRGRGHDVLCVREPGGTALSLGIRKLLLAPDGLVSPEAELLLFSAARAQLVREVIAPALSAGKVVLADRFGWSTLAYQGYGRGLNHDQIRTLFKISCGEIWPRVSILLDLQVTEMRARLAARGAATEASASAGPDRMEKEKQDFFERVRQGYLAIAQANPDGFKVLNGGQSPAVVQQAIFTLVTEGLVSG